MNQFVDFTLDIITYSRYWPKYRVNPNSQRGVVLFGHPNMIHLEVIIRNILSMLNDQWAMLVLTNSSSYQKTGQLCSFLDSNIQIEIAHSFDLLTGQLDLNLYYQDLLNLDFWSKLNWEKILVIHSDTLITDRRFLELVNQQSNLNSHFSFTLDSKLMEIGNGGLILRNLVDIQKQLVLYPICNSVTRTINQFMIQYELNILPEFYLYEQLIDSNHRYLSIQNQVQLIGYWVHCPWNLGNHWQNYLKTILTPKFIVNIGQSLKYFTIQSVDLEPNHESFNLVDITELVDEHLINYWYGLIIGQKDQKINLADRNPMLFQMCLGLYSNVSIKNCPIEVNRISDPIDLIREMDYSVRLVYSRLTYYLKKYKLNGLDQIVNSVKNSNQINIYFYDLTKNQLDSKFDPNAYNILAVNDLLEVDKYWYHNPILFILSYSTEIRDKLKSLIMISRYNYFGYYREIPCLLMGSYADLTIKDILQLMTKFESPKKATIFLKQNEKLITNEIIPDQIIRLILSGSIVVTNNQHVSDYFNGTVAMRQAYHKNSVKTNRKNWIKMVNVIRHHYSIEHRLVIILAIVDLLIGQQFSIASTILTDSPTNTLMESESKTNQKRLMSTKKFKSLSYLTKNSIISNTKWIGSNLPLAKQSTQNGNGNNMFKKNKLVSHHIKKNHLIVTKPASPPLIPSTVKSTRLRTPMINAKNYPIILTQFGNRKHLKTNISPYQTISTTRW